MAAANGSFAKQVAASTVHKACKSSGDTSQDWNVTILDRGPDLRASLGLETTVEHVQSGDGEGQKVGVAAPVLVAVKKFSLRTLRS